MNEAQNPAGTGRIFVVYDGECPFCSAYVRMLRLRDASSDGVELVDARSGHPAAAELKGRGFDLDKGMAVKIGEAVYHGDEAVNRLALMTGPSGALNRIHYWVFRDEARSRRLYPFLRGGRNLALRLLGRKKIAEGAKEFPVESAAPRP